MKNSFLMPRLSARLFITLFALLVTFAMPAGAHAALIANWQAEGTANDSAGTNHGTNVGGVTYAAGVAGSAFNFDGVPSRYITLPNAIISNGTWTLEASFKTSKPGVIIGMQDTPASTPASGSYTPLIYIGDDGKLRGAIWNGSVLQVVSPQAVTDDTWHRVAISQSAGTSITIYLDGASLGTLAGTVNAVEQYIQIGQGHTFNWPGIVGWLTGFTGQIDEVTLVDTTAVSAVSATDGACGAANGSSTAVAPTANLCSSGTPSAVTSSSQWDWKCAGIYGGVTATCSASAILQSQTITFTALPTASSSTLYLSPYVSVASGLAPSFTIANATGTAAASVNGSVVTVSGSGTIDISAAQAGNAFYSAATPVIRTLTVTSAAPPAAGSPDSSFNATGTVTDAGSMAILASARQPFDGKIIVAGKTAAGATLDVKRYHGDGTLDTTFTAAQPAAIATGGSSVTARAVTVQADGKILVAGSFVTAGQQCLFLVRYTANGSLDSSFGASGIVTFTGNYNDTVAAYSLAVDGNGNIVVIGDTTFNASTQMLLLRYTSAGIHDTAFGSGGIITGAPDTYGRSVVLQSDGKIVIAGYDSFSNALVWRYDSAGVADPAFGVSGLVSLAGGMYINHALNAAVAPDNDIIVSGESVYPATSRDIIVWKLSSINGSLVAGFGSGGAARYNAGTAAPPVEAGGLVIRPADGAIFVATSIQNGAQFDAAVLNFKADGTLNASFGTGGVISYSKGAGYSSGIASVLLQPNADILASGYTANTALTVWESFATRNVVQYALTITKTGSGTGSVTADSGPISWNVNIGSAPYAAGTTVTLTAMPVAGSSFTGWYGGGCSGTSACTVTMDTAKYVSAGFRRYAVATGTWHTLSLKNDGTVWASGNNAGGQLGDGTTTESLVPVPVGSGLADIIAVSAGYFHSLALRSDGTVWAWGQGGNGELGDGNNADSSLPTQVKDSAGTGSLSGIVAFSGGTNHSVALMNDGTVWTWGMNSDGQLGDGTLVSKNLPVQVPGLTGVIAIAAGSTHTVALKGDGTVWAWGYNGSGGLGNGTNTSSSSPVQAIGLTGIAAIAAGDRDSLALKSDGTVWGWGQNHARQLGDGATCNYTTQDDRNVPVLAASVGLTGITAIAAGANYSLALKNDGTVWAWGANSYGGLGDGTPNASCSGIPVQVKDSAGTGFLSGITAIAGSYYHSAALQDDGTVWTWGMNDHGQSGDGSIGDHYLPVQSLFFRYKVNASVTGAIGGTISCAGTAFLGSTAVCTVTPDANYSIGPITGTCATGALNGTTYTTGVNSADCTVVVTFNAFVNGSCGAPGPFAVNAIPANVALCSSGAPLSMTKTASQWSWSCTGQYGGSNSGTCNATVVAPNTFGVVDESFNVGGITRGVAVIPGTVVLASARNPVNGKIVVAGYNNANNQMLAQRYNSDGSFDTAFTPPSAAAFGNYTSSQAKARAVAVQSDGKTLVAGSYFDDLNYVNKLVLMRYNTDGSLDVDFGTGGVAVFDSGMNNASAYSMVIDVGGNILVTGNIEAMVPPCNVIPVMLLLKYDSSGSLDTTFGTAGVVTYSSGIDAIGRSVIVQPDGKILVSGASGAAAMVWRYNADGTPDSTFGSSGAFATQTADFDVALNVALQPSGKIILSGTSTMSTIRSVMLWRVLADGSGLDIAPATGFGPNGSGGFDGYVSYNGGTISFPEESGGLAVQANGRIVVGSYQTNMSGFLDGLVLGYEADGSPNSAFGTSGVLTYSMAPGDYVAISSLFMQPDNGIVATGYVTNSDFAIYDSFVTRLVGQPLPSYTITPNASGVTLTCPATPVAYGSSATCSGSVPTGNVTLVSGCGGPATKFTGTTFSYVTGALTADCTVSAVAINSLTFSNSLGGLPTATTTMAATDTVPYSSGVSGWLSRGYAVKTDPLGRFVVTGTISGGGQPDHLFVARYLDDFSLDTTCGVTNDQACLVRYDDSAFNSIGKALAIDSNGRVVVTGSIGSSLALLRFTADLVPDTSFGSFGKVVYSETIASFSRGNAVAIAGNGAIIVAGAINYASPDDVLLLRYTSQGIPDTTFGASGVVKFDDGSDDVATGLTLDSAGKIIVAVTSYNGSTQDAMVLKYTTAGALDTTFNSAGTPGLIRYDSGRDDWANAVTVDAANNIIIAGSSFNGTDNDVLLLKYGATGLPVTAFGTNGLVTYQGGVTDDMANAVAVQPDGKIVAAGYSVTALSPTTINLLALRYTASGTLDSTFGASGVWTYTNSAPYNFSYAYGVTIPRTGAIVFAGEQADSSWTNNDLLLGRIDARVPQTITFGTLPALVYNGGGKTISASATSGLGISFSTLTPAVCTVSGSTVTPLTVGICTIAADQAGNGAYFAAAQVSQNVTVAPAAQTITFGPAPQLTSAGASGDVSATATSGLAVLFTSLTPNVCSVSGATVTALTIGLCTVAADQYGDTYYNAAPQATLGITVAALTQSITFGPAPSLSYGGQPGTVSATATSGLPVTLTSLTPVVCSVSGSTVTPLSGGLCTIAADQSGDATFPAAPRVSQDITVALAAQTIGFGQTPALTYGSGAVAIQASASSGLPLVYTSLTPTVCTVSGGSVAALAAGECTIAADQPGDTNFAVALRTTLSFSVGKATPELLWSSPAAITYGTALGSAQLNAAVNVPGTFVYTPASGAILAAGTHNISVTFTPSDTANYTSKTATVSLTVQALPPGQIPTGADGRTTVPVTVAVSGASVSMSAGTLLTDASGNPIRGTLSVSASLMTNVAALPADMAVAHTADGGSLMAFGNSIDIIISAGGATVKTIAPPMVVTMAVPAAFAVPGVRVPYYSFNGSSWALEGIATVKADGTIDMLVGHLSVWAVAKMAPSVTSFTLPAKQTALTVPVTSFSGSDALGITGYLLSESATVPAVSDAAWNTDKPAEFTFPVWGNHTLYAYVKNSDGAISLAKSAMIYIGTDPVVDGIVVPAAVGEPSKAEPQLPDALRNLNFAMKVEIPTASELAHGDVAPLVNGVPQPDGEINLGDTIVILRRVVGL